MHVFFVYRRICIYTHIQGDQVESSDSIQFKKMESLQNKKQRNFRGN